MAVRPCRSGELRGFTVGMGAVKAPTGVAGATGAPSAKQGGCGCGSGAAGTPAQVGSAELGSRSRAGASGSSNATGGAQAVARTAKGKTWGAAPAAAPITLAANTAANNTTQTPARGSVAKPPMEVVPAVGYDDRKGTPIDSIILHGTNAPANQTGRDIVSYWNRTNQLSSNYIVARDGTITQAVPDEFAGRHTGGDGGANGDKLKNDNARSVGIEFVHPLNGSYQPSPEQVKALEDLTRYLQAKHGIPTANVYTHSEAGDPRTGSGRDTFGENGTFDIAGFRSRLL